MLADAPLMISKLLMGLALVAACQLSLPVAADELSDVEKLFRSGDAAQALSKADALIAAKPRDARKRFFKGVMLSDMHRTAEAVQTFKSLIEDFPELSDPYNNLAVLYASQGELTLAAQALQSALRNDPGNALARENLGDVYLALAVQSWTQASAAARRESTDLQRKLRLARAIVGTPAASRTASAPG